MAVGPCIIRDVPRVNASGTIALYNCLRVTEYIYKAQVVPALKYNLLRPDRPGQAIRTGEINMSGNRQSFEINDRYIIVGCAADKCS